MSNQSAFVGKEDAVNASMGGGVGGGGAGGGAGGISPNDSIDKQMEKGNKDMSSGVASALGLGMGALSLLGKAKGLAMGLAKKIPLIYLGYQAVGGADLLSKSEEERHELGLEHAKNNNLIGEDGKLNVGAWALSAVKDLAGTFNAGISLMNQAGEQKMNSQAAQMSAENQMEIGKRQNEKLYEPLAREALGLKPDDMANMTEQQQSMFRAQSASLVSDYMDKNGTTESLRREDGTICSKQMEEARAQTAKSLFESSRSESPEERKSFEEFREIAEERMSHFPKSAAESKSTEIESAVHTNDSQEVAGVTPEASGMQNSPEVSNVGGVGEGEEVPMAMGQSGNENQQQSPRLEQIVPRVYAPLPKDGNKFPSSPDSQTAGQYKERYLNSRSNENAKPNKGGVFASLKSSVAQSIAQNRETTPMPEPQQMAHAGMSHGQDLGMGGGEGMGG